MRRLRGHVHMGVRILPFGLRSAEQKEGREEREYKKLARHHPHGVHPLRRTARPAFFIRAGECNDWDRFAKLLAGARRT